MQYYLALFVYFCLFKGLPRCCKGYLIIGSLGMFFLHSDMKNVDFAAGTVLIGRPHVSWLEHE